MALSLLFLLLVESLIHVAIVYAVENPLMQIHEIQIRPALLDSADDLAFQNHREVVELGVVIWTLGLDSL